MTAQVRIRRQASIDRISPDIYGHFAEHLGRCIYGGVWVGDDDRVETTDGIRMDTVSLLQDLDMPVLRWPGGCFADDYHWQDGVGPREDRPRRRNLWWTQGRENVNEDSNAFGTDEFMQLCDLLDTEPFLAVNVGSSTPEEAVNWIEYCNYDGDTELAELRRENGNEEPYDVNYWGIGNENWGCGGRFAADEYADEYRRFANYFQGFDDWLNPGETEFVACGHIAEEWNREFFERLDEGMNYGPGEFLNMGTPYKLLDNFSIHRYYQAGDDTDFSEEEHYRMMARANKVAADVDNTVEVIEDYLPRRDVSIIVDEWGIWHPQAVPDNGLEQENTVRDALTAASVLDDLHARADVVHMANIAQTVNVLQCLVQTDESDAWTTPTYRVFDLYSKHKGATAVETSIDTEAKTFENEPHDAELVSASASVADDEVFVTVSNRRHDEAEDVEVDLGDGGYSVADAEVLFADFEPDEYSTKANADQFAPDDISPVANGDGTFTVEVAASSVVGVTLTT